MSEFLRAIFAAQDELLELHDEVEREHKALKGNWLGRPRKQHYRLVGASRALLAASKRLDELVRAEHRRNQSK